ASTPWPQGSSRLRSRARSKTTRSGIEPMPRRGRFAGGRSRRRSRAPSYSWSPMRPASLPAPASSWTEAGPRWTDASRRLCRTTGIIGRMRPMRLGVALVTVLAVIACSGTSNPSNTPRASSKSTIVVGVTQEPGTLDVTAQATAAIAEDLRDNLYEGLVRTDPTGKIVPQLARSWDLSPDNRVYTFHLVTASFHDGSPFTAEDVKFSYDRAMDPNTVPANPHLDYWAPVQSVDAVDPHTVKVTLKQFSDGFLFHMGQGSAAIVPKTTHLATTTPPATNLATNPVGTGPFKFESWNRGASLTLVRNDRYWGTRAPLQKVIFKYISDPNAMNNALLAGDIDVISGVTGPEQLGSFTNNASFKVLEGKPTGKIMVAMNNAAGPTRDIRVRQAINYAIDRKAFIDGIQQGHAVPIGSHAVPNDSEPY